MLIPERERALTSSNQRIDWETETLIAHSLRADGFDASEDGTGRGTPIVPVQCNGSNVGTELPLLRRGSGSVAGGVPAVAYAIGSHAGAADGDQTNRSHAAGGPVGLGISEEQAYALRGGRTQAIAFTASDYESGTFEPCDVARPLTTSTDRSRSAPVAVQEAQTGVREYDTAGALRANGPGHDPVGTRIRSASGVRRLMPVECEKLQGLPPGYTAITYRGKPAKDGPRYKAIGNSMAVPVIGWILKRIDWLETHVPRSERVA